MAESNEIPAVTPLQIKIALHGPENSGKTAFQVKFVCDCFNPEYTPSCGISYMGKFIMIGDKLCKLNLWDIGGAERLLDVSRMYSRDSLAVILFYDTSDNLGFDKIPELLTFHKSSMQPNSLLFIVGSKIDCGNNTPAITKAVSFCNERGIKHFLSSSRTGENIANIVLEIAKECLRLVF